MAGQRKRNMYKFSHIDAFYQIARYVKKINSDPECPQKYKIKGNIKFRGTTKLHGTNSGVVHNGVTDKLTTQSRSRVITPGDDNAGFSAFIEKNHDAVLEIFHQLRGNNGIEGSKKLALYGEWIGPGIQKGVAINDLPEKQWVLFAVKMADEDDVKYLDCCPKFGDKYKENNIFSIFDGPTWELIVDFEDTISKEKAIAVFEEATKSVEDECPWAKKFGISGLGEGIVWQPLGTYLGKSDLFFKTKGQKHKATSSKSKKESMDPEILRSIDEFLEFSLTTNRLDQGFDYLKEAGHDVDLKSTGHYLKWVCGDVQRECQLELEDNKLEWKQVAKALNVRARNYFLEKMKENV